MSTSYRAIKEDGSLAQLRFSAVFDGRMEKYGVRESTPENRSDMGRCLTDGEKCLWVYEDRLEPDIVCSLTRRFLNGVPAKILDAIEDEFDIRLVSEYEPEYWGFATEEEWRRCEAEADRAWDTGIPNEFAERFYGQCWKYLRGELHSLKPETKGLLYAQIAKRVVAGNPELTDDKSKLLRALGIIYLARDIADVPEKITEAKIADGVETAQHNLGAMVREAAAVNTPKCASTSAKDWLLEQIRQAMQRKG